MEPEDITSVSCNGNDHNDDDDAIARGGVATPFPWKLHDMLEDAHKEGHTWIVSWAEHGRSFTVHKPKAFVEKIMPTYFNQTKYASFQRQLNLYGFSRLTHGTDKGAYFHRCFVRGQRSLCRGMVRQKIKGTKVRRTLAPEEEPNFMGVDASEQELQVQVEPKKTTKQQRLAKRAERQNKVVQSALAITDTFGDEIVEEEAPGLALTSSGGDDGAASDSEDSTTTAQTTASFLEYVKGGDLLFFEGLPFHYLEHMEELPPPPPPPRIGPQPMWQQPQLPIQKKWVQPNQLPNVVMSEQSYFPRDSLQSLMRVDPQAIMGSFRRPSPQQP